MKKKTFQQNLPTKWFTCQISAHLHKPILNYCILKFWSVNSGSAFVHSLICKIFGTVNILTEKFGRIVPPTKSFHLVEVSRNLNDPHDSMFSDSLLHMLLSILNWNILAKIIKLYVWNSLAKLDIHWFLS